MGNAQSAFGNSPVNVTDPSGLGDQADDVKFWRDLAQETDKCEGLKRLGWYFWRKIAGPTDPVVNLVNGIQSGKALGDLAAKRGLGAALAEAGKGLSGYTDAKEAVKAYKAGDTQLASAYAADALTRIVQAMALAYGGAKVGGGWVKGPPKARRVPRVTDTPLLEGDPGHAPCDPWPGRGKAPEQVEPGTRNVRGVYNPSDRAAAEPYSAHYDEYGRQIGRTDYTNQPDPATHTNPHHHTVEHGPGYGPKGKETGPIPGPHPLDERH